MSLHNEQVQKEIDAVQKQIDELKSKDINIDYKKLKMLLSERTTLEAKLIDGK